mmetsp:Transcript_92451/g.205350  ORF Transcript_92451/g.205350 Transcript_92451/m.205350 type:complete len:250 (-) Transcript_92451:302-1051(-)
MTGSLSAQKETRGVRCSHCKTMRSTTKEKASECVPKSNNAAPSNQIAKPRQICDHGVGPTASMRRPSGPMEKGTSPSGSGAEAKYFMLMLAPNDRVLKATLATMPVMIQPIGQLKNGSRMLNHACRSKLLEETTQPSSTSRTAGKKVKRAMESAVKLPPKGTAPWIVPRTCRMIHQIKTTETTTKEQTPPIPACKNLLSRNGIQNDINTKPPTARTKTRGSIWLSQTARTLSIPSGNFCTKTQPPCGGK